jgi:hypothetical protein
MLRNKESYGERLCNIKYEDLIKRPESVMRYLSDFLDIEFDSVLLTPNLNGYPISADTSFELEKQKIIESTLYRYKTLSPEELSEIHSMTSDDYETLLGHTVRF